MSVIAAPETPALARGQRSTVATKYPRIARGVIDQIGASAEIIPLGGSVELAAVLRLTTHIIDLVQSGATIAANGLVEQATLMTIAPWLIAGRDAYRTETKRIRDLASRIEETINAVV
jgi:ATP phosphoribosyltransferase